MWYFDMSMNRHNASELLDFMVEAGRVLVQKAGNIDDIGVMKQYLTEEDLRIERQIKRIVSKSLGSFYAEEENENFVDADSVWICDPISGTQTFIEGKSHYAIVVSHMTKGKVDFAAVYDPSEDKLYVADQEGLFINGEKFTRPKTKTNTIVYTPSRSWVDKELAESLRKKLESKYTLAPYQGSMAINYCMSSEGLFDGVVSLSKDSFPEFAGLFIANKAGLVATNINGDKSLSPSDRIFICGTSENYDDLLVTTRDAIKA